MQTKTQQESSADMNLCIQNCLDTARICLETIAYCLQTGNKYSDHSHIRLLHDCVEICQTSTDFMIRKSAYHPIVCGICATISKACADSSEQISGNDQTMKECAKACRRCAESCEKMS